MGIMTWLKRSGSTNVTAEVSANDPLPTNDFVRTTWVSTTTPLGISGVFTSSTIDTLVAKRLVGYVTSDAAGTLHQEISDNNSVWIRPGGAKSIALAANTVVEFDFVLTTRYTRLVYVNGAAPQTAFRLNAATLSD